MNLPPKLAKAMSVLRADAQTIFIGRRKAFVNTRPRAESLSEKDHDSEEEKKKSILSPPDGNNEV